MTSLDLVHPLPRTVAARVLIVDDHTTFAELLGGALDREVDLSSVGFATTVRQAVELHRELLPDVIVMDYHLPDGNGLDAAAVILAVDPTVRIIMLTGDPTPEAIDRAVGLGVCAFLPKDGSLAVMLETLRHARSNGFVMHPSLMAQLSAHRQQNISHLPIPCLSPRELDVLRLMSEGKDVRSNARTLSISESTCRGYVKAVLAKLEVHSQLEAVVKAGKMGILPASLSA